MSKKQPETQITETVQKRPRGRPRKNFLEPTSVKSSRKSILTKSAEPEQRKLFFEPLSPVIQST